MHLTVAAPVALSLLLMGPQPAIASDYALKLLISVESQSIRTPYPVRVTLHLHNSGAEPIWLYRHATGRAVSISGSPGEATARFTRGGPTVEAQFGATNPRSGAAQPILGRVLEAVGLPRPRLEKLPPGEDYEEKVVLQPAFADAPNSPDGTEPPLTGRFSLTVKYAASYSNADEIARNLKANVWQGEVTSNAVELELAPPQAAWRGAVAGTITNQQGHTVEGELVSLSDQSERLIDQAMTGSQGRYAFGSLPPGLYWVTIRRHGSPVDTALYKHAELTAATPTAEVSFIRTPPETYDPKQMLHKPVLLRVVDNRGQPVGGAKLEVTWSTADVLDNVKAQSDENGMAAVNLIPGRNFVSTKRKGCTDHDERLDMAEGEGIDDALLTMDCR